MKELDATLVDVAEKIDRLGLPPERFGKVLGEVARGVVAGSGLDQTLRGGELDEPVKTIKGLCLPSHENTILAELVSAAVERAAIEARSEYGESKKAKGAKRGESEKPGNETQQETVTQVFQQKLTRLFGPPSAQGSGERAAPAPSRSAP